MKSLTLSSLLLAAILVACTGGDSDNSTATPSATGTTVETPQPETSATPQVSPTESASVTPSATETPTSIPVDAITPENIDGIEAVSSVAFEGPQYFAWQRDGKLLVAGREEAILIDPDSDATETVYSGAGQERIVAVSDYGQIATARPDDMGVDIRNLTGEIETGIDLAGQFGAVDFSDDGSLLATSRLDEIAVDIWRTDTGDLNQEVAGFETAAPVYSASLSPRGDRLIWLSRGTVQVSDLAEGSITPAMQHEQFVSALAIDDEERFLVTTWAAFATVWDPQTGERIEDLDQEGPAYAPAILPDSDLLVVATDDGLKLWNLESFMQVGSVDVTARQLAFAADAAYLATVDANGLVQVWAAPQE